MTRRLRVAAPAKINWTLEVLRRRPDGYHEIRSVLQTVDLMDGVTLSEARGIELEVSGDVGGLRDASPEENLAFRAATLLRRRIRRAGGVRIELVKRIPVAAGLGGGSSDAAAVLRGCNELWSAGLDHEALVELAAEAGSDPPFFIVGGCATASGRGELVEPLPDPPAARMVLAIPAAQHRGEKTAAMYDALTPEHYSEGEATMGVRETIASGHTVADEQIANVFERVVGALEPETEVAMEAVRAAGFVAHLAGSGPAFFVIVADDARAQGASSRIRQLGWDAREVRTLGRAQATAVQGVG